jgi:hypothetical protein
MTPRLTAIVAALAFAPVAVAQVDTGLLTPWPDQIRGQAAGRALLFADSETDNANADFDLRVYEARGRYRLGDEESGSPSVGFRVKYLDIHSDDAALPPRLVDQAVGVGMGIGYFDAFGQMWQVGFTAGIGYAGNNPFADGDAVYFLGNLVAKAELDEKSELRLILNFDGNRGIFPDIPLPAIAYTRQLSDALQLTVGFPYSGLRWQIDDRLRFTAQYFFPLDGDAELAYQVHDDWTLFVGYESSYDPFWINGVENRRLFFKQRRVEAGVRWSPGAMPAAEFTVAGGYAFDQKFESGWDVRDTDTIARVDGMPYARLALSIEF